MEKEVILITGATSGYGKATAKLFVQNGYSVIITGRNAEKLESAAKEIGADPFCADATSFSDWEALRDYVMNKYGRIDMLLNNAGGGVAIKDIAEQSKEEIDGSISLNLTSAAYGCRVFAPVFISQGFGTVMNVSSVCAKQAWPGWGVYGAAKWGVLGLTKGLSVELAPHGVRVTCLVPGAGDTNFDKNANFTGRGSVPGLKAENVAEAIYGIYKLPKNVWVEEMTVWGIDQVVIPL
ncbi:MAG: SDR family oxidoreductase [Clostridiales bacterium]|nr:SDR family oxidoreductase [Clostridiales bacterium]